MTVKDPKRVLTTVGFQALQFNTGKKQFVAARNVPIAVGHPAYIMCRKRPFNNQWLAL